MKTHILRALTEKSFSYLWFGEVFTQIAINTLNFFLVLFVYELTHSNTAVSGIIITYTIPAIIFGSIAGAYVDRWDKRTVLIFSNVARALLLIILAINIENLAVLYILSFLIAVITQFFIPAETPMIPLTVRKENLLSANALFGMAFSGSVVVAYLLAAPLLAWLGSVPTLFILAAILGLGAIFVYFVKVKGKPLVSSHKIKNRPNVFQEIKLAFQIFTQTKVISQAISLLALAQVLTLIIATVAPGYASQVLGIELKRFALYFAAPAAIGMVVGGIVLVNFFHNARKKYMINAGIFLSGICLMLLPLGSEVASRTIIQTINNFLPAFLDINILRTVVVLIFLIGVGNALVFVPSNTIVQEQTSDASRGKIYGFLNTIVGVLSLLPVILVGGLSDLIGVGSVLVGIGLSLFLLAVYNILRP
ncbi:MAG: MFS transporter [Patescibacteria group bacterium]